MDMALHLLLTLTTKLGLLISTRIKCSVLDTTLDSRVLRFVDDIHAASGIVEHAYGWRNVLPE